MSEERPDDREARDLSELLPDLYAELRALAGHFLAGERPEHTLQPTALAHEAYLKLARQRKTRFEGRTQVLALAAGAMRRILVDHARKRRAARRGGDWFRITLDESVAVTAGGLIDVLSLEVALRKLEKLDPDAARIVELRFFGGLTEVETAHCLGISERWARLQWAHARAWLRKEMGRPPE